MRLIRSLLLVLSLLVSGVAMSADLPSSHDEPIYAEEGWIEAARWGFDRAEWQEVEKSKLAADRDLVNRLTGHVLPVGWPIDEVRFLFDGLEESSWHVRVIEPRGTGDAILIDRDGRVLYLPDTWGVAVADDPSKLSIGIVREQSFEEIAWTPHRKTVFIRNVNTY